MYALVSMYVPLDGTASPIMPIPYIPYTHWRTKSLKQYRTDLVLFAAFGDTCMIIFCPVSVDHNEGTLGLAILPSYTK